MIDMIQQFRTMVIDDIDEKKEKLNNKLVEKPKTSLSHPALWKSKIAVLGTNEIAVELALQLQNAGINANVLESIQKGYDGVIDVRPLRVEGGIDAIQCSRQTFLAAKSIATDPKVFVVATSLGPKLMLTKSLLVAPSA